MWGVCLVRAQLRARPNVGAIPSKCITAKVATHLLGMGAILKLTRQVVDAHLILYIIQGREDIYPGGHFAGDIDLKVAGSDPTRGLLIECVSFNFYAPFYTICNRS